MKAVECFSRSRAARGVGLAGLVTSLSMIVHGPAVADPAAQAAPTAITSAQAERMLAQLRAIRRLLEKNSTAARPATAAAAAPAAEKVSVAVRDANALGRDDAPITMVEFADFQCPFCRRFHTDTFEQIKKNFIDTGKLRYVSRDLPLPMHDQAPQAASAARCAGDQHHFWELRHVLMLNQDKVGRDDLRRYASELNLDVPAFTSCLDSRRYDAATQQDAADAAEVGVIGTPTFIIGRTSRKGRFEGIKIVGVQSYAAFETKIQEFLAEASPAARVAGGDFREQAMK